MTRPLGYAIPRQLIPEIRDFSQTNIFVSVGWAIVYHTSILLAATAAFSAWEYNFFLGALTYGFAMVFIARQLRGIELMVHDGSHFNWCRKSRFANDTLTDLLCGWPIFSQVKSYREGHLVHHKQFGSAADPCYRRYQLTGMLKLTAMSAADIAKTMRHHVFQYMLSYYWQIGSSVRHLGAGLAGHFLIVLAPLALLLGSASEALLLWCVFFLIPFLTVLPFLRMIAEAEEHLYEGRTEFAATVNNLGLFHRFLDHPWFDGYHIIHHVVPSVPQYRHARMHRWLMKSDATYYSNSNTRHAPLGKAWR